MVEVTQEDREAYLAMNMRPEFDAADVRAGLWDKVTGLQAFARHRIAAENAAQQEITALDAARGDRVAQVLEFIREQQANAHRHMLEAAHRKTASLFAAAFVTLRNLAEAIERGEPFNG